MDSADQTQRTLVYADGYSYTEFFQTPGQPGAASANKLISVFHAFLTPDRPATSAAAERLPNAEAATDKPA